MGQEKRTVAVGCPVVTPTQLMNAVARKDRTLEQELNQRIDLEVLNVISRFVDTCKEPIAAIFAVKSINVIIIMQGLANR